MKIELSYHNIRIILSALLVIISIMGLLNAPTVTTVAFLTMSITLLLADVTNKKNYNDKIEEQQKNIDELRKQSLKELMEDDPEYLAEILEEHPTASDVDSYTIESDDKKLEVEKN